MIRRQYRGWIRQFVSLDGIRCRRAGERSCIVIATCFLVLVVYVCASFSLRDDGRRSKRLTLGRNGVVKSYMIMPDTNNDELINKQVEDGGGPAGAPPVEPPRQPEGGPPGHAGESEGGTGLSNKFTIILQTFNRTDLLIRILNHYVAAPNLHKILVIWNNMEEQPPTELWTDSGPHPAEVYFLMQSANKMYNRFMINVDNIETRAILMLDDDLIISHHDLGFGFSVWKQFPQSLVGFAARAHKTSDGVHTYHSFEAVRDKYSIMLIGQVFLDKSHLVTFQGHMGRWTAGRLRELLDAEATFRCEDLALNFIVAKETPGNYAVLVEPTDVRNVEMNAASGFPGLWHAPEHFLRRSQCLTALADIYGGMALRYSNMVISQYGFPAYQKFRRGYF